MSHFLGRSRTSCVLAITVALGLSAAPRFAAAEDEPLELMPNNADVVALIKVAEILESPAFKKVQKEFPEIHAKLDEPLGKKTKLTPHDIESVFVAADTAKKEFVVVVTMTEEVDEDDLLSGDDEKGTPETIGDYTLYVKADDSALCLVDEYTIAAGPAKTLRAVLKRDDDAEITDELDAAWEDVDDTQHVYVVATLGALMKQAAAGLPPGFPLTPETLAKVETGSLTANADRQITVSLDLNCADKATAGQLKALLDLVLQSQQQNPGTPAEIKEGLGSIKASVEDETLTVSSSVGIDLILNQVKDKLPPAKP